MTDLTVTLTGETADKLRKLMAEEEFDTPEEAIGELLETVGEPLDPEMKQWLQEVARRADESERDPSTNLTPDQVRQLLARD